MGSSTSQPPYPPRPKSGNALRFMPDGKSFLLSKADPARQLRPGEDRGDDPLHFAQESAQPAISTHWEPRTGGDPPW